MANNPHILITNDDGIDSHFLRVLVESLATAFRVTVAAPMAEQSWIGRAMSRSGEVHIADFHDFPCRAYALDGTPADCVNIALGHLLVDDYPQAVVSGINLGYNATLPLIYSSGTLGGALEGAFKGLPALAFSHQVPKDQYENLRGSHGRADGDLAESLRHAADHARLLTQKHAAEKPQRPLVHNINFPVNTRPDTLVRNTRPAPMHLPSLFSRETQGTFRFRYFEARPEDSPDFDFGCLQRGWISHTVLDFAAIGG